MKRILLLVASFLALGAQAQDLPDHPVFRKVFPIQADGKMINVTTGHAAPLIYDFNRDGVKDLLVGEFGEVDYDGIDTGEAHDYVQGRCRIYINHGTDKAPVYKDFEYLQEEGGQPMAVPVTCCISFVPRFVDFNGDGIDDVLSGSFSGEIFYWQGKGNGRFGAREQICDREGKPLQPTHSVTAEPVDWDADGDFDLLVISRMTGIYLYENTGSCTGYEFSQPQVLKLQEDDNRWEPSHLYPYDWNKDGLFDLVAGTEGGDIALYLNKGTVHHPQFFERTPLWNNPDRDSCQEPYPLGYRVKVFVYDYDGDGKEDVLAGDFNTLDHFFRRATDKELKKVKQLTERIESLNHDFFNAPEVKAASKKSNQVKDWPGFEEYNGKKIRLYEQREAIESRYKENRTYGNVWVFLRK